MQLRPFFLLLTLSSCSLLTNVDGLRPTTDAQAPTDASADRAADAPDDAGDAALDPSWTLPLASRSDLNAVVVDANGDVYVAGSISDPFTLGAVNVTSAGGSDAFVMKLDGKTKKPIGGVSYGGTGYDTGYGMAFGNGARFLVGATTSTTLSFGPKRVTIPPASPVTNQTFIAKLDPTDGAAVWVISPDSGRTPNVAHSSTCNSIAAKGTQIAVGCVFTGANFAQQAYTPATQATAVVRYFDATFNAQQSWFKAFAPGFGTVVSIDQAGDVWFSGTVLSTTAVKDEGGAIVLTGTAPVNVYVAKILDGTHVAGSAKSWTTDTANLIPANVTALAFGGNDLFVGGSFEGTANFGLTPVLSDGALDAFVLHLTPTRDTQNQLTFGGKGFDQVTALAPDDAGGVYGAIAWNGAGTSVAGKAQPAQPGGINQQAKARTKIDGTGNGTATSPLLSESGKVRWIDLEYRSSLV